MQEPDPLLRWIMFHFAGGDALFVGILVLVAIAVWERGKAAAWRWSLVTLLAVVWGGLSSPAWPTFALILVAAAILGWRIGVHRAPENSSRARILTRCVGVALLGVAVLEWFAARSSPDVKLPPRLCVIADSITAGLNDGEYTWPQRLAAQTGIDIRDASQPGATFRSALKQAEWLDDNRSPLLLEIGGNDLLSGVSVEQFGHDFETLCRKIATPGRVTWMCELPLPPLSSRYGWQQRRIGYQHGIRLIPKRKMMRLLTTPGATVDGIHLSERGQALFCDFLQGEMSQD